MSKKPAGPLYQPNDRVRVNGVEMIIRSWPAENTGPFYAVYYRPDGGEVAGIYWTGQVDEETKQVQQAALVELLERGAGERTTLGDLPPELLNAAAEDEKAAKTGSHKPRTHAEVAHSLTGQ